MNIDIGYNSREVIKLKTNQRVKINNKNLSQHNELGVYIEDCDIFMFHGIVKLDRYPKVNHRFLIDDIQKINP